MRVFELLLFLSCACMVAFLFISNQRIRRLCLLCTSGLASTLLLAHLIVEGYSIQMFFLYVIPVLTLVLSLITSIRAQTNMRTASRIRRMLAPFSIVLGLIATVVFNYVFPVFDLPVPTGPLKTGTQVFHFVDSDRDEIFGDATNGKRELMVQVWYPAEESTGKYAPFIPDSGILPYMAENYGLPGFVFHHLKYVSSHSYTAALVSSSQTSYPLILASPGFGSSRFLHTSQAENLASHGYIVAAIDHTYNTFATEFPDGRITTDTASKLFSPDHDYATESRNRNKLGKILTDDVLFVLDQLEQIQSGHIPSQLQGRIDLSHVGVFGHSIGGATAYDVSYDPRILAGIDLDGGLYRLGDREGLKKPILFINSESGYEKLKRVIDNRNYTDAELHQMGDTREWVNQVMKDKQLELERMRETIAAGGEVLYIEKTEHLNFADVQFFSPMFSMLGITGKLPPERANSIINAYMLDFFDMYLKQKGGGTLIKGRDSRFPEVKLINP